MPEGTLETTGAATMVERPASGIQAIWYSIAQLGAGFFYAFNNATLPLILVQFTQNPFLIGLLSSTRSIEGTVIQPIIGSWSDRTWTALGRRRIFMAVGVGVSAIFFLLAPFAPSLPLLVAAVVLFSLFFNAAADPYNALLADRFPVEQRSSTNGIAQLFQFVGQVAVILGIAKLASEGHIALAFDVVALAMVVTFGITILKVPEDRHLPHEALLVNDEIAAEAPGVSSSSGGSKLSAYIAALLRHKKAFRLLTSLFWYNIGVNAILPYLTLFAKNVLKTNDEGATLLFLGLVLATGLFVVPAGMLGRRFGNKKMLALGMAMMAVTAPAGLLVQNVSQTLIIVVLAGLANSAITASNWPLLTELIPPEEVGVFAGIKTSFESVAIPASVAGSSLLIEHIGYRSIFLVLTLGAILATAILPTVRVQETYAS